MSKVQPLIGGKINDKNNEPVIKVELLTKITINLLH